MNNTEQQQYSKTSTATSRICCNRTLRADSYIAITSTSFSTLPGLTLAIAPRGARV
jgi:hypothetical protein